MSDSAIAKYLIDNFDSKIKKYFNQKSLGKWESGYKKKAGDKYIKHAETWLTLVASYALFGNQEEIQFKAINKLFGNKDILKDIREIILEKQLLEIKSYNKFLKGILNDYNFHLYQDKKTKIEEKLEEEKASFEGNTNLDLMITGKNENADNVVCFVEAKFMSDIDNKTTYNLFRDQIVRIIDAGIDYCKNEKTKLENFHFILLTPEIFKPETKKHNKIKETLGVENSRLYCYKFKEYQNAENLKKALPHRKEEVTSQQWEQISKNMRWITFEDIYNVAYEFKTMEETEKQMIYEFFSERNLTN